MAFKAKELDTSKINEGNEYKNGDAIQAQAINEIVCGVLYAQEGAIQSDSGGNMFDNVFGEYGYIEPSNGQDAEASGNWAKRTSKYYPIPNGTLYFVTSEVRDSLVFVFYDENKNYVGYKSFNDEEMGQYVMGQKGYFRLYTYANFSGSIYFSIVAPDDPIDYNYKPQIEEDKNKLTIVNFGDSIFGNTQNYTSISAQIAKMRGDIVYNCGFGGCRMSTHAENWDLCSMYRLADCIASNDFAQLVTATNSGWSGMPNYFDDTAKVLANDIDFSKVDYITISYGTNDYREGKRLDNNDWDNELNMFDNCFDGEGYIDPNNGQNAEASGNWAKRTSKYYPIPKNTSTVYLWHSLHTTAPTSFVLVCYNENREHVGYVSSADNSQKATLTLPDGTAYFRVYTDKSYHGYSYITTTYIEGMTQYDINTVCGALRYSIMRILGRYPNIKILVTTPIFRTFFENEKNYAVAEYSDTKDWGGGTLLQYADAIKNACVEMKVPCLDLYNESLLNEYTRLYYYPTDDGTHPNENGRKHIADLVGKGIIYGQVSSGGSGSGSGSVEVDSALSLDSENPVQNKVVTEAINQKVNQQYVDNKFNGANKAVSFENYSSMISTLNGLDKSSYNVGQNIMIVTLDVPDLWVSGIDDVKNAYPNSPDALIVEDLKLYKSIQVGYFKLSALETQKVDLSEYATNEALNQTNEALNQKANTTYVDEQIGLNKAEHFDNYESFNDEYNLADKEDHPIRELIFTKDLPPLWVSAKENTQIYYTKSKDDFINDLKTTGSVGIGYHVLKPLEFDLIEYVKNTDYATSSKAGVIKTGSGMSVDNNGKLQLNRLSTGQSDGYYKNALTNTGLIQTGGALAKMVKMALAYPDFYTSLPANWTEEEKALARQTIGATKLYKHIVSYDYTQGNYNSTNTIIFYSTSGNVESYSIVAEGELVYIENIDNIVSIPRYEDTFFVGFMELDAGIATSYAFTIKYNSDITISNIQKVVE